MPFEVGNERASKWANKSSRCRKQMSLQKSRWLTWYPAPWFYTISSFSPLTSCKLGLSMVSAHFGSDITLWTWHETKLHLVLTQVQPTVGRWWTQLSECDIWLNCVWFWIPFVERLDISEICSPSQHCPFNWLKFTHDSATKGFFFWKRRGEKRKLVSLLSQ